MESCAGVLVPGRQSPTPLWNPRVHYDTEQDWNQDMEACFTAFDKDGDGLLTLLDFGALSRTLFRNAQGKAYQVDDDKVKDMFDVFDDNQDGFIDQQEFRFCWSRWIKPIVRPTSALIIVDVQNDFISGTLAISKCPAKHDGAEVLAPINSLLDNVRFETVIYTLDWHPDDHISFVENVGLRKLHSSCRIKVDDVRPYDTVIFEGPPLIEQKLWPKHCVQGSWGSELHPNLKVVDNKEYVYKGLNSDVDSYSAFWDNNKVSETDLYVKLEQRRITDVYVCGLAYDICVGSTARHALERGFRTVLVEDATRGITVEQIQLTRKQLDIESAAVVTSDTVAAMVEGRDRRLELGYYAAMRLRGQYKTTKNMDSP